MRTLHDAPHRAQIVQRVQALRPDSQRRWGKMSVDQMLWHVNDATRPRSARFERRRTSRRFRGAC